MLEIRDFVHLPRVESLIAQVVAGGPGLILVAGLEPRPAGGGEGFLPSGRGAIHRLLMRQILAEQPGAQAIVVAERGDGRRVPRALRRRVAVATPRPSESYAEAAAHAARRRPHLLVIDRLTAGTAPIALEAARDGLRVLSQLDTVFCGAEVARHLADWGASPELLRELAWVVAVQRLPTLCPDCKAPVSLESAQRTELLRRFPDLAATIEGGRFFQARGCERCRHSGRAGEITAFDLYHADPDAGGAGPLTRPSLLPMDVYLLELAARGELPPEDALEFDAERLRRTYRLLSTSEAAEAEASSALEVRLAELEAANRVLQQRTEALIALESIGQALTLSAGLDGLAAQLCRSARDLCGADRSILYFLRPEQGLAEVLAVCGWDASVVGQPLEATLVFGEEPGTEPTAYHRRPPAVARDPTDVTSGALRAGLRVPLVVQDELVGLMIVHTSRKARFEPGEVALLQTFANQAAVAIQRVGLIEALRDKVRQLEAAQVELVQKERLERELELARQVQQSVLPRIFPLVPGYAFGARNRPARQVGGDFYDVILLDADRFGLVIGDVSDKGMPAALFMALTRSLILAEARQPTGGASYQGSPGAVLTRVHHLLQELGQPGLFVTVFYGVIDGPARRLTYARAGHDRPFLVRRAEARLLGGEGTFLGFPDLTDLHLTEEQVDLAPGDWLVLYTDGVTDALSPDGEAFGRERLADYLQGATTLSPDELCSIAFADVAAFQQDAEQYDDMTLLAVAVE